MAFTILNEADAFNTNQAEVDSVDITILVSALDGTAIVSGCAVTAQGSPNMTVAVASGVVIIAGTRASVTGANVTITTADGTNPRFDLIVSNGSGTLSATAGTAAEDRANRVNALEMEIRRDDGTDVVVVQSADRQFQAGQRVRLIGSGANLSVAPY